MLLYLNIKLPGIVDTLAGVSSMSKVKECSLPTMMCSATMESFWVISTILSTYQVIGSVILARRCSHSSSLPPSGVELPPSGVECPPSGGGLPPCGGGLVDSNKREIYKLYTLNISPWSHY